MSLKRHQRWLGLGSALAVVASCHKAPALPDVEKMTAGRTLVTLAYSANLWGELTECG